MALHKEYHQTDKGTIKFSVSYVKGKGYRVSAFPVKISNEDGYSVETFGAFTGFNDTLLPCTRQSSKRLEQAIKILGENKEKYLQYGFNYNI